VQETLASGTDYISLCSSQEVVMLTYQVRPRIFRLESEKPLAFPVECELRFHFQPGQPFGAEAGGGRTLVQHVAASTFFDANSGTSTAVAKKPLSPLDVVVEAPNMVVRLEGATLTITGTFESLNVVEQTIEGVFFVLPTLLNVEFADPPYVERVDGMIGTVGFGWELARWAGQYVVTSQETQERHFMEAWTRMSVVSVPGRRRLAAALHYFHVACRLGCSGRTAGEFVAEAILNLAKTLEVLFPPAGGGDARDAARVGLRTLGLADERIEADFIPSMALRNEIDVGHVGLGLFKPEHLEAIHAYVERAERAFQDMLQLLLTRVEAGDVEIAHHELGPPSKKALEVVERLQRSLRG
jgi:hypothetical protein